MRKKTLFLFILICLLTNCQEDKPILMKANMYILTEDNIELWVETYGEKKDYTVLFISGAGANSSFWSENLCMRLVKEGFFVIKYDHRDFGYSSKLDWEQSPYKFDQLVMDAITILDSLNIEETHVIGHSMGGFIAQLLAINHPVRIESITSISSSTSSTDMPPLPEETWEIFLANTPENNYEKDLPGFIQVWKYLNGTASFDEDLAVKYTKNLYERQDIDGNLGATHVKAQATLKDRTEELTKVKLPSLVIHGEEDYIVNKTGGIMTSQALVNSKLVLIPKMGHMPFNHEILERFEREIIDFLILELSSKN